MATSARLEELQQKFNENPRRYFAPLANEHRKLGDLDQAITLCRSHLPQQPQHVSGHIVLAQALFEAGNTHEARQSFELALDLDPENLIALRFLGDIARTEGDHATARQWYERVLDADPRNDEIARLVRELENGAAAASRATELAAVEPNEQTLDAVASSAAPESVEPLEDLATAWQHEVAALDAASDSAQPAEEPFAEPTPVNVEAVEPTRAEPEFAVQLPEAELEPDIRVPDAEFELVAHMAEADPGAVADSPEAEHEPIAHFAELEPQPMGAAEPSDGGVAVPDFVAAHNEPLAEPGEELAPSAPTSEASPVPHAFAEIDYSQFEAVADEEELAEPPAPMLEEPVAAQPEESVAEAPHAAGDDWFAIPADREAEASVPEIASEASFDLDAAFQSVLPNGQEPAEEETVAPQASLTDLEDHPHSREWAVPESEAVIAEETTFSMQVEGPDSVDDAFAELDRMTASLEAEIAGNAMLLPDEEYAAEEVDAPQHVDALIGRTPETGVPAVEEAPIAFVTETMAELYLQQGFRDEALAVYRQLLSMSPGDAVLAARVRALEGGDEDTLPSEHAESFDAYRVAAPAHADPVGQSMRAFLGVFARRRAPMRRRGRISEDVKPVAQQQPESGLSALFGASPGSDDGVAAVLAGAFAQPNAESEALPGRPTRAAAEELSLGDVFGSDVATSDRAASFDEFFSAGTADRPVRSPLDEEGSDMEQFTAWLEGLKKK